MSRNQWLVLAVLGVSVVVVLCCLGGYALTFLTSPLPTETPAGLQAGDTPSATASSTPSPTLTAAPILPTATSTDTATPTPQDTATSTTEAEPTATPTWPAADAAFLECSETVLGYISAQNSFGGRLFRMWDAGDIDGGCELADPMAQAIARAGEALRRCRRPEDAHLREAHEHLGQCVDALTFMVLNVGEFCLYRDPASVDVLIVFLREAADELDEATALIRTYKNQ